MTVTIDGLRAHNPSGIAIDVDVDTAAGRVWDEATTMKGRPGTRAVIQPGDFGRKKPSRDG